MGRAARLIASGLGSGYAPKAPGTAGSLLALAIGAAALWVSPAALLAGIFVVVPLGVWAIRRSDGAADPGWVVIDEVAGQWTALLGLAMPNPLGLLAAFALFRAFDILKPGPVGWADRQGGEVWVMADDLIAGILSAIVLIVLRLYVPALDDPW